MKLDNFPSNLLNSEVSLTQIMLTDGPRANLSLSVAVLTASSELTDTLKEGCWL